MEIHNGRPGRVTYPKGFICAYVGDGLVLVNSRSV